MARTLVRTISDKPVKNYIINGNMDFWQRGVSFVGAPTTATYQADRFVVYSRLGLTTAYTRETDVPNSESTYSLRWYRGTGVGSTIADVINQIAQTIEGINIVDIIGKEVTLSFYVKQSQIGTFPITIRNPAGNRTYVDTYTVNQANTWEKKSITFTLENNTYNTNTSAGILVRWGVEVGTNWSTASTGWQDGDHYGLDGQDQLFEVNDDYIQLSQVMLTEGKVAPYNFIRYGETYDSELIACKRYYQVIRTAIFVPYGVFRGTGSAAQTTEYPLPVEMRATPSGGQFSSQTLRSFGGLNGSTTASSVVGVISMFSSTPRDYRFSTTAFTVNNGFYSIGNYSSTADWPLDAEL